MKFSFVILTWNRKVFLEKCLAGLLSAIGKREDTEIVVMDNGSDDGTAAILNLYEKNPMFRVFRRRKNYGLRAYKALIRKAKGEYIVVVDDDVLSFPDDIIEIFERYLSAFPEFGYLALDVIQNEHTNGAKPPADSYSDVSRDGMTVQYGPTGGWCTCFRRADYAKVRLRFYLSKIDMRSSEDGLLSALFQQQLGLKSGIIKGHFCFHASGPYYSKENGYLDRDIEKYKASGLDSFAEAYEEFR